MSEREKPALEKLDAATECWQEKVRDLQKAIEADPGSMEAIALIFGQEQQAVNALFHNLDAMRQNLVEAEEYLKFLDEQIVPFYAKMRDRMDKLEAGAVAKEVRESAKVYFASIDDLIDAAREVARIRPELKKELIPLQQRFGELQDEAEELIQSFKEEAKRYRDSLR
jgi:cell division FtsZ-interacting protein ZapD